MTEKPVELTDAEIRGGRMSTDRDAQQVQWDQFVSKCRAKGLCEFSGLRVTRCVQSICDCFETPEGALEIERKAAAQAYVRVEMSGGEESGR